MVRLKKTQDGDIWGLEIEEILDDPATVLMIIVKQLGMKLNAKQPLPNMLHCLDLAGFIASRPAEPIRQLLHFIAVRVPNHYFRRQTFEEPASRILDGKVTSLAFGALITFPGFKTFH